MKNKLLYILLLIVSFTTLGSFASSSGKSQPARKEQADTPVEVTIQEFIQHMVEAYHLDQKKLRTWLGKTSPDKKVLSYMTQPYEKVVTWDTYRKHFITRQRISDGVAFWRSHQKTLKTAEKNYGVPAYIIVGILGVETNFGKVKMHFKALKSLVTLAFYYPPRSDFFKQELEEYLLLTHEHNIAPETLYSSYAGALGIPQFMPSCYRKYSVSSHIGDHKKPDLIGDFNDAIFSIANYLRIRGHWKPHTPVTIRTSMVGQKNPDKLCSSNTKPRHSVSHYKKLGVKPLEGVKLTHQATLIKLVKKNRPSYWLTFKNFSAIMEYNPRIYYAMTVYQLGKAIQHEMEKTGSSQT
jgi:membrane-bound lytic murein transglycosylase B